MCIRDRFTSLVFIATIVLTVYIPSTQGYFNLGETMVYTSAIVLGPFEGALVSGLGSMLADMILAPHYAPATTIIKGLEALIVGLLYEKLSKMSLKALRTIILTLGVLLSILITYLGISYYSGEVSLGPDINITVWGSGTTLSVSPVNVVIGSELWFAFGAIVFIIIMLASQRAPSHIIPLIISIFGGGVIMVSGYFIYEVYILYAGIIQSSCSLNEAILLASYEIPFNVMQVLIGMIVGIPLIMRLKMIGYGIREQEH